MYEKIKNMDEKEKNLLRTYAILSDKLDKYVYLREDSQGRYIEYAFREGAPHDNRCLSWYDKPQPNAYERNGHSYSLCHRKVDEIYYLTEFACDAQNKTGDDHCSAGHPCKKCLDGWAEHWTYEEPVKCACWCLVEIKKSGYSSVSIDIETAAELLPLLIKYKKKDE